MKNSALTKRTHHHTQTTISSHTHNTHHSHTHLNITSSRNFQNFPQFKILKLLGDGPLSLSLNMNPQQLIRDLSRSSDPRLRRARHGLSKAKDDLKLKGDLCNNVSHIYAYVISLSSLFSIYFLRNSYHIIHLSLVIHLIITHTLTLTSSHTY